MYNIRGDEKITNKRGVDLNRIERGIDVPDVCQQKYYVVDEDKIILWR